MGRENSGGCDTKGGGRGGIQARNRSDFDRKIGAVIIQPMIGGVYSYFKVLVITG